MALFERPGRNAFSSLRKRFGSMAVAFAYYQSIRDRWADGEELTGEDAASVLHLLRTHPRWREKVTVPVLSFTVESVTDDRGGVTRAFHWVDDVGGKHSFSYLKCLRNVFGGVEWRNNSRQKANKARLQKRDDKTQKKANDKI